MVAVKYLVVALNFTRNLPILARLASILPLLVFVGPWFVGPLDRLLVAAGERGTAAGASGGAGAL